MRGVHSIKSLLCQELDSYPLIGTKFQLVDPLYAEASDEQAQFDRG